MAGQIIVRSFRWGKNGRKRFELAIQNLPSMRTIGDIVHFGFGIDSIVRNLCATEEGGILVMLCATAAECYHEDQAANIMLELARAYKTPDQFTPSARQWKSLIKACAGSLSKSEFSKVAEHFMSLGDLYYGNDQDRREIRGCSSPDTIAKLYSTSARYRLENSGQSQ